MLKSKELVKMIFLSDNFSAEEKGVLGTAVATYQSTGVASFSGYERIGDYFYTLIKPLIDNEKESSGSLSSVRAAAGSRGGKAKAKKKNVANVAKVANEANVANVAKVANEANVANVAKVANEANVANVAKVANEANVANVANANFAKSAVKASETALESSLAVSECSNKHHHNGSLEDGGDNNINNINNITTTKEEDVTESGGGEKMDKTTNITVTGPQNDDPHPKKERDVLTGSGLKPGETVKLVGGDENDNVVLTRCLPCKEEFCGQKESNGLSGKCDCGLKEQSDDSVSATTNPSPVTFRYGTVEENVVSSKSNRKTDPCEGAVLAGREKDTRSSVAAYGNEPDERRLSAEQKKSYILLLDNGVWPDRSLEYAQEYDFERIERNVKLKRKELGQGSNIRNPAAVILKAIDDDQAGYMLMWSKEKERKISKESLEVISRMR